MKKVRRRVVERDTSDQPEQSTENQPNPVFVYESFKTQKPTTDAPQQQPSQIQDKLTERLTHGKRSQILIPPPQTQPETQVSNPNLKDKVNDESSISPNSQLKQDNEPPKIQPIQSTDNNKQTGVKSAEEDKKSRIEMLKQKYLKKTPQIKIEMNKAPEVPKEPIVQKPKILPPQIQEPKIQIKNEPKNIPILKQQAKPQPKLQQKIEEKYIVSQPTPVSTIIHSREQALPLPKVVPKKQDVVEDVKPIEQAQSKNEVERMQEKKPFKVPPPPTTKSNPHKTKLPPPPIAKTHEHQEEEVFVKDIPSENKAEEPMSLPQAPPQENEISKPMFVPPPPIKNTKPTKSALVQEILSKKMKREEAKPKNQTQQQYQNVNWDAITPTPKEEAIVQPQAQPKQKKQQQWVQYESQPVNEKSYTVPEAINLWLKTPAILLQKYIPNINNILPFNDAAEKDFKFTSNNPNFNSSINAMINEFILKNKSVLSDGQKNASYALTLQYFDSNTYKLSPQVLLILTKLGSSFLERHASGVISNLEENAVVILSNRSYFSQQELSAFTSFILDQKEIWESEIMHLLLINANDRLVNMLNGKNFNNIQYIVSLLACINLIKKQNPNITAVYLKLINILIDNLPDDQSIAEIILKHVNELQTNQKNYQIHKQVKLKLINLLSSQNSQKTEVKATSAPQIKENTADGGLLGYWNKAVDKIKTATTQFADVKQPRPQEEEEKEEVITYDPVLKRYLINGKVPEGQDQRPADPSASKLPPPPPPKIANRPAPPPIPGKKGRITNRYA